MDIRDLNLSGLLFVDVHEQTGEMAQNAINILTKILTITLN